MDSLATAIFSFGIGVLAQAVKLTASAVQTAAPFVNFDNSRNTSELLSCIAAMTAD
jgi:hypothetical protein